MPLSEKIPKKYDAVLIVGPNASNGYIEEIQEHAEKAGKSLCIVGDGKHGVSKAAIARSIEGRVDDDTLFILDGHGHAMFGRHWISLLSGPLPARSTLSVIDILLNITSREGVRSPTVCVFSCFAGEVASHIQRREKGIDATIVAHGPADDSTYDNFSFASIVNYVVNGRVLFLDAQGGVVYEELVTEPDPITIIYPNKLTPVVYDPVRNAITRQKMIDDGVDYPLGALDSRSLENIVYLCALRGKRKDLKELLKIEEVDHIALFVRAFEDDPSCSRQVTKVLLKAGANPTGLDMDALEIDVEPNTRTLVEKAQRQWKREHPESTLSEAGADKSVGGASNIIER